MRTGIVLRVDDALNLRLTLEPGAVSDSVSVVAAAELLEERSSTVGQVVDEKTMQQLPLNGRNYLQLGNLSAGAVPNTRSRDRTFSAYGNRGLQNAFLLDGARNQNYLRGLDNRQRDAMRPQLEAISEFKVQTSNYSAEYGASAGAVVNVVTKSGTNSIHGSAFEFLRNNKMDARDYFLPASSKQPLYIQHQFGGSLGGPFVKNRAWWQGAFQRTHITEGETTTSTVPLASEKSGQFALPVFDPLTLAAGARAQFPNNTIPASRFDRIGKRMVDLFPDPLLALPARNYVLNPLQATRSNNATIRGDIRLSDADTLFARFSLDDGQYRRLPALPVGAQTGVNRDTPARSLGLGYTRVITPTAINELRVAYNFIQVSQDATLPKDEILAGSLAPRIETSFPTFGVTVYPTLGDQPAGFGNNPLNKQSKVWNISDNLSLVRGKHTLKFGFDFQDIFVPTFAALNGRGSFGFSGVFTQNPQRRPGSGHAIADLLLGLPNTITTGTPADANERARNYYWYAQDDWTVTPRLTLNIGLRYELTRPFFDQNDRLANLILDDGHPLYGQYVLAGDPQLPRSLQTTDRNNIAPRVGFAWRPNGVGGLVVRGGSGIFYAQDEGFGVSQRTTNNPPFVGFGGYNLVSDQLNISSTIPLSGTLPARPAVPDRSNYVFDRRATTQIRTWPTRFTIPYVAQWNLSIQKDLGKNLVWEVNYVGNRGIKLWGVYEGNQPLPGPGSVNDRRPLAALTRASILRFDPWVNSTYHGISTRLERRFAQGFNFLAVYTFGRSLDTQSNVDLCDGCGGSGGSGAIMDARNRRLQYGLSDHHIAQRFVMSGLWELPFAKTNKVLGGWALSGIATLASGPPFTLTLNFDNANTGTTNWPNRLARGDSPDPTINRWFDTAAFAFPAQYALGNAGRNILTGPGTVSTDASLQRNFPLPWGERSRVEFRAEAFNLFNTPQFGVPNAVLGNPAFGTIGGTARSNRQMQLGLRLLW
ncbi:MAG: TonB-dependent receptor [Bryobacterales bacterium]|nr:TonB-dependent receptor [Bryobacterales bacterium]